MDLKSLLVDNSTLVNEDEDTVGKSLSDTAKLDDVYFNSEDILEETFIKSIEGVSQNSAITSE